MPPPQRIVDHLANFHNAPRISPILAVYPDTKNDIAVFKPRRVFCTADFGIIRRGDAIA